MRANLGRLFGMLSLAAVVASAVASPRTQQTDPKPAAEPAKAPPPAPATRTTSSTPTTPPSPALSTAATLVPTPRDRREAARQNAEKSLRQTMLPVPMTPERFAAFVAAVDPSLSNNADLAAQYATYTEQAKAALESSSARITDRLPAAYSFDAAREVFVARPNPELVQALVLREKTAAQLHSAERALLRAVLLATPAERKIRFVEERLAWIDERTPRDGLLPSTRLTLFEILARARVSPESLAAAEPILIAHAERLASLRESRNAMLRDGDLRRARIETEAGTLWRLDAPERARATEALLAGVDDIEFGTEIAIREHHFDTLRKLRGRLGAQEGRRVIEEWQRSVHPELFDDERLLSRLVESVIALPSSAPEVDDAILDAVDTAYRKLEPLARDASTAADLVLPRMLDRSDESLDAEVKARLAVLAVQTKRRATVRDLVARVRGIAATSDAPTIAQFDSLAESLASLERADQFDRSSLEALARGIAARAEETRAEAERKAAEPTSTPTPGTTTTSPTASPSTSPSAADRAKPSDTRPPADDRDASGGGNRSGRGSRRQQGSPN